LKAQRNEMMRLLITAGCLIAPVIINPTDPIPASGDFSSNGVSSSIAAAVAGFDWISHSLTSTKGDVNELLSLAVAEIEISKASHLLKEKEFELAIDVLKKFEKVKGDRHRQAALSRAAVNLSFLYYLEGNYSSAEKYSLMALNADRYNASALVNQVRRRQWSLIGIFFLGQLFRCIWPE
jgi:tetratricopeptide (TPR) repeat protein